MLAPPGFHEQTIGLNGGTVRAGWHGDPGAGAERVLHRARRVHRPECQILPGDLGIAAGRSGPGAVRPGRWADGWPGDRHWTDNGAAYCTGRTRG